MVNGKRNKGIKIGKIHRRTIVQATINSKALAPKIVVAQQAAVNDISPMPRRIQRDEAHPKAHCGFTC